MNFKKLLIGTAAVLSLASCSKSNDNKTGAAAVSAPALAEGNASGYAIGTPNIIFSVDSHAVAVDGVTIDKIDDSTFSGFSMLSSQVSDLEAVNKVIETKENAVELYSGDSLLLALDIRSGSPTLLHSKSGAFQIESAIWKLNEAGGQGQKQGLASADLTINMRECAVEQKQEQKQEQGKQEEGKQSQGQEQGKKFSAVAATVNMSDTEGQGQGQGQEQGKKEEKPVQNCKLASVTFHLSEMEQAKQEQKQEQGKQEQGKQDQAKPSDQGQEQAKPTEKGKQEEVKPEEKGKQDQAKPEEKGKQDQAKPEEKRKQEQAKPEEKGKQEEAKPVDQGKQDQGKQDQGKKS